MNRIEEIVSSQEFSDVRDKWMVACAVMMSKGYTCSKIFIF